MLSLISDSVKTVVRHYKTGNLNWPMIIYISLAHVAAVIGLFSISKCHPYTLLWAFLLWPFTGIGGITGGVHRLWSHRSYKATFFLRVVLMLANSMANQGSIWHWSRDHRVHHKYAEVNKLCLISNLQFFF
jgi:stearoyl-CoA desaturase (Delta-9 desaturase)